MNPKLFQKGFPLTLAAMLISCPAMKLEAVAHSTKTFRQLAVDTIQQQRPYIVDYVYPGNKQLAEKESAIAENSRSASNSITLRNGTPVVIQLTESISSDNQAVGTQISFKVVGDVKVADRVVIQAGTLGQAQIVDVDDNGIAGQGGKITLSDFTVRGVDGTQIPLRATLSQKGKDKTVLSVGLAVIICLPFILMKGGNATIAAGVEKTAYVASDTEIKLDPSHP